MMAINGYLSKFSLPEVLQLLQEGNKTGLLTVRSRSDTSCDLIQESTPDAVLDSTSKICHYFIWLHHGQIVAAADRSDYRGLVKMIAQRKWIVSSDLNRWIRQCPLRMPLGLYLKSQDLLSGEQMKLLFTVQIIRQICALFELVDGSFDFISDVKLPYLEMTGISIPATDITLPGLRSLQDWSALSNKLPQTTSILVRSIQGNPSIKLNEKELKIWALTDEKMPIAEMMKRLDLPLETVRRTAFCLTVTGLAEEVPMVRKAANLEHSAVSPDPSPTNAPSQVFLDRIRGFLEQKAKLRAMHK